MSIEANIEYNEYLLSCGYVSVDIMKDLDQVEIECIKYINIPYLDLDCCF